MSYVVVRRCIKPNPNPDLNLSPTPDGDHMQVLRLVDSIHRAEDFVQLDDGLLRTIESYDRFHRSCPDPDAEPYVKPSLVPRGKRLTRDAGAAPATGSLGSNRSATRIAKFLQKKAMCVAD